MILYVLCEQLTFRLPFGGYGIPWKRLKIGPQCIAKTCGKLSLVSDNGYHVVCYCHRKGVAETTKFLTHVLFHPEVRLFQFLWCHL